MKAITIRFFDDELEQIESIKKHYEIATINGAIRRALLDAVDFQKLKHEISQVFQKQVVADERKAQALLYKWKFKL